MMFFFLMRRAVMQYVMFNSVPLELVLPVQNLNTKEDRVKTLLKYLRRFGVPEEYIFEERDLFEFKNVPKVTRCVAMLAKMVSERSSARIKKNDETNTLFQARMKGFEHISLDIPDEDEIFYSDSD